MSKWFLFLVVLLIATIGVRKVIEGLRSDETRIEILIEEAVDGFNRTRLSPAIKPLASNWHDQSSSIGREELKGALINMFFTAIDPNTKAFLYRLEAPKLEVLVTGDESAELKLTLELYEVSAASEKLTWLFDVQSELALSSEGWRIQSSNWQSREGGLPGK